MTEVAECPDTNGPGIATQVELFPEEWKQRIAAEKIVSSPYEAVDVPDVSLPEFVFKYLDKYGEKILMIDAIDDRKFTYKTTSDLSKRVSSGLIRLGLQPGEIVAIFSDNHPEYVISLLAIASVGAVVCGVCPLYSIGELLYELKDTGPSFLIVDTRHKSMALKAVQEVPSIRKMILLDDAENPFLPFSQLLEDDGTMFKEPFPVNPRDHVLYINHSSGTTGLPKGAMHTHFSTVAVLSQMLHPQAHYVPEAATVQHVSPLFQSYGILLIWNAATTGSTAILIPEYACETFLSSIEKYKITSLPIVPTDSFFLLKDSMVDEYDLSSVNDIVCAGSPLFGEQQSLLTKKFHARVRQVYGMTEGSRMTIIPMDFPRLQSVGIPMPSTAMKVVDTKTSELCGPNQHGEICFRANYMMKGYWKNPEATAQLIHQDGWLHTGDVGYYDEDGYFYVVDRIKEIIKHMAYAVAPTEIESLLLMHPLVKEAAVIGVPDEDSDELPRAYIVLWKPNTLSEQEILDFVSERKSQPKHLKGGVIFVDDIPKTASGKILRKELRKQLLTSILINGAAISA